MRKICAVCDFLSEENKEQMRETAAKCGFEIGFYENPTEADGKVSDCEVYYSGSSAMIDQMPDVKWCHSAFAGVERFIDSGRFESGEVILTNSSGAYGRTISEHVIMVTLMLLRQMKEYEKIIDARKWVQDLPVRSIADSRVAVIGTGDIGRNAAKRFRALGASEVIGFNRSGRGHNEFDYVYRLEEIDSILAEACFDIILLCVPGTAESAGILSAKRISMLSDRTYVINVGRGTAIDQDALLEALDEGKIAGAALDVVCPEPLPAEHPLWTARNCIITPHMSGDMGLPYTVDKTVEFFCENLERYTRGEELINKVDISAGY